MRNLWDMLIPDPGLAMRVVLMLLVLFGLKMAGNTVSGE